MIPDKDPSTGADIPLINRENEYGEQASPGLLFCAECACLTKTENMRWADGEWICKLCLK